ncbi:hypothetical protein P7L75_01445 (plasmid) [Tistrella mobilis]|uniref:hypothetical protein n=1 Tax=Tistrella mobilis TaxID=171437 RepID=UPI00355676CD
MTHLRIRTAAGQSHRRAGRRWTDEPQIVAIADLSPAEAEALRADKRLFVEAVEPAPEAKARKSKAPADPASASTTPPEEGKGGD